ncbi:MAG: hypothetical protein WBQ08_13665 [Candidatus Sulfotelmatobacter sp.]
MNDNKGLLSGGYEKVVRNKRYIFWFWLLNLTLAEFGVAAFRNQAHAILDNSLYSGGLVHGFDLGVFIEMLARPEFGPTTASTMPAVFFACLFFVFTVLFLPGVFLGYASNYRLPRDEFFRACGRNLWRFIRLLIVAGIVMGVVAGILFAGRGALVKAAGESTNEVLGFEVSMACLLVIFLVMTTLRIWFDLAEADIVLSDQKAVRRSIGAAFRHTFRHLGRLLTGYVVTAIVAGIILLAGIWLWRHGVAPDRLGRAFLVTQVTLFLLLIPRFWQRGIAVAYWQREMMVHALPPLASAPVTAPSGIAASSATV